MRTIKTRISVLLLICSISPMGVVAQEDRSGPTITLQSVVYQSGDKWYCPLCRLEVDNGDRSGIDLRLCLSEWHDVFLDQNFFHDKVRYITDEELINSLHIEEIEPALQSASKAGDHQRVSGILQKYFAARNDNNRLSSYDQQNKKYFITIDDFLKEVVSDSLRQEAVIRSANAFYTPEKGFTFHGVHWGRHIDFNHTYPDVSKWGVHYLSFINDQVNYYLLKRDPDTPRAFEDVFNQWYDQLDSVKHEHVINVKTSYDFIWYELGLSNRTQKLIDAYRVFSRHMSPETHTRLLKIILGSARWLNQCLKQTPFHPYNWQTHTALTLSYAAVAFPEFSESEAWLDRGRNNMVLHLEKDILDDGGYVERTSSYAEYMFSVYYRYMLMMQYFKNDASLREKYMRRLEKNMEFFVLTISPPGLNTAFNDASRGKGLVRLFKEMGEFFHRGDFIGAVRHEFSPEELASMSVRVEEPRTKSIDFPDSRYTVMRDSWDPRSYFMMVNYGDWQNHSHFDQLSFEIYANGIPIALDAGLGKLGYLDSLHVTWYKHPLSHNMITVNRAVPEKMDKPGYDKYWSPLQQFEFFAATHDGYARYQKAKHRRHIVFSKARYWLIVDEVTTVGKHQEMEFHLHTPSSMMEIDDGYISTQENGFLMKHDHLDASAIRRTRTSGGANLNGLPGEPGNREIDWLIFGKMLTGDRRSDRIATLIYPFASKGDLIPADVSVERMDLKDDVAIGYRVKTEDREDIIIVSDGKYRTFTEKIEGDFKYGVVSSTAGRVTYAGVSSVARYRIGGVGEESFNVRRDVEHKK